MTRSIKVGCWSPPKVIGVFFLCSALLGCSTDDGAISDVVVTESESGPESELFGLDDRAANLSCVAPQRPANSGGVTVDKPFPLLKLNGLSVTNVFQNSNDLSHWYLTSRFGTLYRFDNDPDVTSLETVLDLSNHVSTYYGELGLLNAIFHPNFPADPRIFVYYVGLEDVGDVHLSSFTSSDGGATFDLESERTIFTLPQSQQHHKGGGLQFDEEGYLYVSIGDAGDRIAAQDPGSFYGTLIRIDIDSGAPYQIPPDNPFVLANGGAPEVFAYGLRNPWRFSIDRQTGEIWLGDVGGSAWEEVNKIEPGGNYGWPVREGAHCWRASDDQCDSTGLIDPLFEYPHPHDGRSSVIGGLVYRGSAIPGLFGKYIYADYATRMIWALETDGNEVISNELLVSGLSHVSAFAQDKNGEVLIVRGSHIARLIPALDTTADQSIPQLLSETGCFDQNDPTTPLNALIPYDVNSEFWSDGADKKRWMALPDGQYVDISDDGDFLFPRGTVLIKEFSLNNKRIETRFLVRYEDGGWGGYTYLWNDDESDAELLRTGTELSIGDQLYTIPNENQCAQCHTEVANDALGLEVNQLNRTMLYPSSGLSANQLSTLEHIGLFSKTLPDKPSALAKLSRIDDESQTTDERIRSYLHSNCSQCHRPGGEERASADFRYTAKNGMGVCNVDPQISDLGIEGAKLIAPGDPDRSVVMARIKKTGTDQMPPIARNVLHTEAISLLEEFIANLESCD